MALAPLRPNINRPSFIVHFLWHGFTFCSQDGKPADWPEDHRWVTSPHEREVTCLKCKLELEWRQMLPLLVQPLPPSSEDED